MKRKILSLVFILASLTYFSVFPVSDVRAEEEIPEEKLSNIETNCASIKESLKRTQNADKNTRISLGRTYQTLLTDFITPLNVRLMKNNRFDSTLADLQLNFSNDRDTFNQAYIEYSKAFEILLSIDCRNEPTRFYRQLEEARTKRKTVSKAAIKLSTDISDGAKSVEDYITWFRENVNE
ncbi:hypothetical protein IJF91_02885 [Candidatus Saccharibacteria bacterium]|nr:hypothetical protein [Candidatus Saccharibacteria bacterium]